MAGSEVNQKTCLTAKQIIETCGGEGRVSRLCGISPNAVRSWSLYDYIPPSAWPYLVTTNRDAITHEELEALYFRAKSRRTRRHGGQVGE